MTREEAIKILKSKMDGSVDTSYEWAETVRMAIEALEGKDTNVPTKDCISRQAAMAYPLSWEHYDKEHGDRKFISGVESYREYIEQLPSAQEEIVRCKDCKHRHLDGMIWDCPFGLTGGEDFFCAYGAKMKGADDE